VNILHIEKTARLSRVVVHGNIAYFSGITADDQSQDTRGQTAQILAKADGFLAKVGSNRSLILNATIWLLNIADFDDMNIAWLDWIDKDAPPARATVQAVMALPDIRVEIMFTVAIAL
jgi:enamine deaminase RidA (YjgF/YER057c/UK114 family)